MGVARSKRRQSPKPPPRRRKTGYPTVLTFTIPSNFAKGRKVRDRILAQVRRCGYDSSSRFAIRLATEEALINAIKHGNKLDPAKKVMIQASIDPKKVVIVIEDQGKGFDRRKVPDPRTEANLCKCSGRGILLMEAYMNSVRWSKHGRRVRMVRLNPRYLKLKH